MEPTYMISKNEDDFQESAIAEILLWLHRRRDKDMDDWSAIAEISTRFSPEILWVLQIQNLQQQKLHYGLHLCDGYPRWPNDLQ